METVFMSVKEWIGVRDNPIQRDTKRHAAKALRGHLREAAETHAAVAAARLPGGELIKLDGHTRSLLWENGKLTAPKVLTVNVYAVESEAGAIALYKTFDNASATEGAGDRLSGAFRQSNISPKSRLLTQGGITTALSMIDPDAVVYTSVATWRQELIALDDLGTDHRAMPSVLVCAALITQRLRGPRSMDFWRLYIAGGGTRIDGKSCGVDALARLVADLRARGMLAVNEALKKDQAGKAISCCDAWLEGRVYAGGVKSTDFAEQIALIKRSTACAPATKGGPRVY